MNEVESTVTEIVTNVLRGASVDTEKTFEELGYDDLDLTETVMHAEQAFDIDISETMVSLDMSINKLIILIKHLLNPKAINGGGAQ